MKYLEIEFKYSAKIISLASFQEFCQARSPLKIKTPSGWDHFYDKPSEPDCFARLRVGSDMNQLTFKKKTDIKNNFIRVEDNIDLLKSMDRPRIEAFIKNIAGYEYNSSIFKTCFIYKYDVYNFVYYTVYDMEMKEVGRYVEIEMDEKHPWSSEDEAWNHLLVLEKMAKPLGISSKNRIKESLFELHRKAAT